MSWPRAFALALLSFSVAPTRPPRAREEPIPRLDLKRPPTSADAPWTKRSARVTALRVRLDGLGIKTHKNWVLWRLPFDATDLEHIRRVDFSISSPARTNVAALKVGSICAEVPTEGAIEEWTSYSMTGIAWTQRFSWHPAPPTDDPTILGLNVPTRVANYVACGWDQGALKDPAAWVLDLVWEER